MVAEVNARATAAEAKEPTARELTEKHDRLLLRCKQLSRPVLHNGLKQFIAGLHWHKGDAECVVYLEGSAEPVRPRDITIIEEAT